jgi:hypothetical protein
MDSKACMPNAVHALVRLLQQNNESGSSSTVLGGRGQST